MYKKLRLFTIIYIFHNNREVRFQKSFYNKSEFPPLKVITRGGDGGERFRDTHLRGEM